LVHPLIIIGCNGFIGRHFCKAFPEALAIGRTELDLFYPEITFETAGRSVAVIAAGIGNPRSCERDPEKSYQCNVVGTLSLGKELLKRGILPILFSTDYVYDDSLQVAPLNVYGRQKAELEVKGTELGALVIRLSKVYGIEKGDKTLFDEMAALLQAGKQVRAARDQIFAPIYVGDVISHVLECILKGKRGIVTLAGPTCGSRLEMARKMAEKMGADEKLVSEISLDELQDGVLRPKRLALQGNLSALAWQEGVEKVVKAYVQRNK
jgi:dTDP-4-dehydrorhamnose reductase